MKETLINFKTAKLAKEKGFSEYGYYFYTEEDGLCSIDSDGEILNIYDENLNQIDYRYDYNGDFWFNDEGDVFYTSEKYLSPTQSLLAKWLREEHHLIVIVAYQYEHDSTPYSYWIYKENNSLPLNQWINDLHTYEEALELGLIEALKLI